MSIELPANLEGELEMYARSEHLSLTEAAVKLIQLGLRTRSSKSQAVPALSENELEELKGFGKTFGLLADVPEEAIDRMAATIRRAKRERFPTRA